MDSVIAFLHVLALFEVTSALVDCCIHLVVVVRKNWGKILNRIKRVAIGVLVVWCFEVDACLQLIWSFPPLGIMSKFRTSSNGSCGGCR
jgi:hypothetical protein